MDELKIETLENGDTATLTLTGRLTTTTAPELKDALGEVIKNIPNVILDCTALEYVSSAGLRVLKKAYQYKQSDGGSFVLKNVNEMVMEILDMVGLAEALTIE